MNASDIALLQAANNAVADAPPNRASRRSMGQRGAMFTQPAPGLPRPMRRSGESILAHAGLVLTRRQRKAVARANKAAKDRGLL